MGSRASLLLVLWSIGFGGGGEAAATPEQAPGKEVRRWVLALWDSKGLELEVDSEVPVHQLLEMPLNQLGVLVRAHDIRQGPPSAKALEGIRAIVTQFQYTDSSPEWLWPFLEREIPARKLRVVHFGDFGPLLGGAGKKAAPRLRRWLARFGLEFDGYYHADPLGLRAWFRDKKLCCLEGNPLSKGVDRGPVNRSDRNRVWVRLTRSNLPEDPARCPVVTGPWGGIALDPWAMYPGTEADDRRWYLNPFVFFREALGLEGVPAPHPSVLNGRRMFFVHVDGDGFESLSTVQRNTLCAKIYLDQVLERYELPMTISIIVRSLTHDIAIEEPTPHMRLASTILNHPRVEAASHAVLHPLRWDWQIKRKDRRRVNWYRGLQNYDHNMHAEVRESIRFINERLMTGGRRCRVMLWSGEANPPEDIIQETVRSGCMNLNGGVFRWDGFYDSLGFVFPWAHLKGDAVQVLCGAANENVFEGFFTTMPGAFAHIDTTIERTGRHGILKPANIYIHFYSAANPLRLRSIHKLIQRWGFEEPTAPVFASTYCEAVHDAITKARILRTTRGWAFRDFGRCPTVRIDGEDRSVDFAQSRGLLGAKRMHGALYLHLAEENAEVVFAEDPSARPHIREANHALTQAQLESRGLRFTSTSLARRLVIAAGFPPKRAIDARFDSEARVLQSDANGMVHIQLPPGKTRIELRVR